MMDGGIGGAAAMVTVPIGGAAAAGILLGGITSAVLGPPIGRAATMMVISKKN